MKNMGAVEDTMLIEAVHSRVRHSPIVVMETTSRAVCLDASHVLVSRLTEQITVDTPRMSLIRLYCHPSLPLFVGYSCPRGLSHGVIYTLTRHTLTVRIEIEPISSTAMTLRLPLPVRLVVLSAWLLKGTGAVESSEPHKKYKKI